MSHRGRTALRRRRGAVAIMMAVMMPVVLAASGLGIDYGVWQRESIRLQLATDAAAMGAGRLLSAQTASAEDFRVAAMAEFDAVSGNSWIGTLDPLPTIDVAVDWSSVTVTFTSLADSYFSRAVGVSPPTLHATARSGLIVQQTSCVLALNGSASQAILVDNMGSITATGCGIFSNSNAATAIYLNSGTLNAQSIGAVGGVAHSNSGSNTLTPTGSSGEAAQTDPFAGAQPPEPGGCSYNNASFTAWRATPYQFTQAANVFCGNTTIGGNASTDTFEPGVYYVVNGNLTFNNAAITQAAGVSFILTGSNPGAFSWTNYSNTATTMTAPTTGPTAGMLVWQTCPASGSAPASSMAGGSTLQMGGQFYAPCGALNLSNNAHLVAAPNTQMGVVAATMHVAGSASISANWTGGGGQSSGMVTLLQ